MLDHCMRQRLVLKASLETRMVHTDYFKDTAVRQLARETAATYVPD